MVIIAEDFTNRFEPQAQKKKVGYGGDSPCYNNGSEMGHQRHCLSTGLTSMFMKDSKMV